MISVIDEIQVSPGAAVLPGEEREKSVVVFDIETGPAPADVIDRHMPEIEAPANYKDPVKIEAYKAEQREKYVQKAALSPLTGRVLAIGAWADGIYHRFICDETEGAEAECIRWFWGLVSTRTVLVGFNSNGFDLPFLFRRSWALGIPAPKGRLDRQFRPEVSVHVDLLDLWRLGDRHLFISLDAVSRYLGIGEKSGEGELFYQVLRAFPEEAEAYLKNDVRLTFELAKRLEVIHPELEFEETGSVCADTDY